MDFFFRPPMPVVQESVVKSGGYHNSDCHGMVSRAASTLLGRELQQGGFYGPPREDVWTRPGFYRDWPTGLFGAPRGPGL